MFLADRYMCITSFLQMLSHWVSVRTVPSDWPALLSVWSVPAAYCLVLPVGSEGEAASPKICCRYTPLGSSRHCVSHRRVQISPSPSCLEAKASSAAMSCAQSQKEMLIQRNLKEKSFINFANCACNRHEQ